MSNQPSDALVFFGATGDLAYKKIFPALQDLKIKCYGQPLTTVHCPFSLLPRQCTATRRGFAAKVIALVALGQRLQDAA